MGGGDCARQFADTSPPLETAELHSDLIAS